MARRLIGVRLTADELTALRRIPGESDSARLRALLHRETVAQSIAEAVATKVKPLIQAEGAETRKLVNTTGLAAGEGFRRLRDLIHKLLPPEAK
jgi:hypothetical protein